MAWRETSPNWQLLLINYTTFFERPCFIKGTITMRNVNSSLNLAYIWFEKKNNGQQHTGFLSDKELVLRMDIHSNHCEARHSLLGEETSCNNICCICAKTFDILGGCFKWILRQKKIRTFTQLVWLRDAENSHIVFYFSVCSQGTNT